MSGLHPRGGVGLGAEGARGVGGERKWLGWVWGWGRIDGGRKEGVGVSTRLVVLLNNIVQCGLKYSVGDR